MTTKTIASETLSLLESDLISRKVIISPFVSARQARDARKRDCAVPPFVSARQARDARKKDCEAPLRSAKGNRLRKQTESTNHESLKKENKLNLLFGFHGSLILARKLAGYSPRTDQEIIPSLKVLFFICMFLASSAYGVNGQETFLQANKAYQEKSYEKALTLFSKIEKKGSATWYNMGNCYYQLGHQADAIACWKRAQKGSSKTVFQDAAYNIDVALHEQASAGKNVWREASLLLLQLLFLVTWFLFIGGLILSKRGKKYKVATFILAMMVIAQGVHLGYSATHRNELVAFVRKDTNLYAGPNEQFHVVGNVAPKDQLCVYTKSDNWYKVAHGNQVGWVQFESIIIV